MGWQGDGTFVRGNGTNSGDETWQDDAAAATAIRADRHDTHDQDLADGIAACLTKNGESKPAAHLAPGVTGTYNLGTSSLKWQDMFINGVATLGGNLLTDEDSTNDIGTASVRWKDLYIDSIIATDSISVASKNIYPKTSGAPTATTSGTAHEYTSLPDTLTEIHCMVAALSVSGTEIPRIQLGDATTSGYITTGYDTATAQIADGTVPQIRNTASGIYLDQDTAAGKQYNGIITIRLLDPANFIYAYSGNLAELNGAAISVGGAVALAGLIDRVRIIADSTDTFDNGSFNISHG